VCCIVAVFPFSLCAQSSIRWNETKQSLWLSQLEIPIAFSDWEKRMHSPTMTALEEVAAKQPVWSYDLTATQRDFQSVLLKRLEALSLSLSEVIARSEITPERARYREWWRKLQVLRFRWGENSKEAEEAFRVEIPKLQAAGSDWHPLYMYVSRGIQSLQDPTYATFFAVANSITESDLIPKDKKVQLWQHLAETLQKFPALKEAFWQDQAFFRKALHHIGIALAEYRLIEETYPTNRARATARSRAKELEQVITQLHEPTSNACAANVSKLAPPSAPGTKEEL
jgi:hypothetical protein